MNKTTIKMSVLAFLGFMTYGYAQQQQQDPYKGKVGVNTITPSATMDIRPNDTNARAEATTNEGIIAPKLSKVRIANIIAPVEGTLVYATDDATSTIASYTGNDPKVVKITEKGYYFYNGTEWVKAGSEDTNSEIWQKQANKDILLVDNDIQNTVKYTEHGGQINIPKVQRPINRWNPTTNSIESFTDVNTRNIGNSGNLNIQYADKVSENYIDPTYKEKQMNYNLFMVDGNSNTSLINRFVSNNNQLQTSGTLTKDIQSLYSKVNSAEHFGSGRVTFALMGVFNNAGINNGSANRVVGAYNQANSRTSSDINSMEGTFSFVTPRGTGKINTANGTRNHLHITNSSTSTITHAALTRNLAEITEGFTGTIENLSGTHTNFQIHSSVTGIKNMYGLKIDNVDKGTTINRAIHTEAGQIRFGDLISSNATNNAATTADKPVFVTPDGVLKVGAASGTMTSKWINDTSNNTVKLANLSDGVTIRENMKNMIITDLGEVGIGVYNNGNLGKLGVRNSLKLPNVPVVSIGTLINTNDNVSQGLMFYTDNTDFPARIDVVRGGSSQETGLAFLSSNKATPIEQMRITPTGNIGIGTTTPTEKLDVAGKIKSSALAGTGDRVVVADQDGVLKTSQFIMKATDTTSDCTASNEGAIHYKTIMKNGKKIGVFGFCTRNSNGDLMWSYNVGGNNIFDGTGAFGSGL